MCSWTLVQYCKPLQRTTDHAEVRYLIAGALPFLFGLYFDEHVKGMTLGIFGFFEIFIWIWTGEDIEQPSLLGFERGEAVG